MTSPQFVSWSLVCDSTVGKGKGEGEEGGGGCEVSSTVVSGEADTLVIVFVVVASSTVDARRGETFVDVILTHETCVT